MNDPIREARGVLLGVAVGIWLWTAGAIAYSIIR